MNADARDKPESAPRAASGVLWRLDAAGAADGTGLCVSPAGMIVESMAGESDRDAPPWRCRLVALGHPSDIDRHPASGEIPPTLRLRMPDSVVVPGFVNAHAHLDLTHIGPRPYDPAGGFVGWAMSLVRPNRAVTLEAALRSLRIGVGCSLFGGVVAVGDILGAVPEAGADARDARAVLNDELIAGFGAGFAVGFAEVFGMGVSERFAAASLEGLAREGCALQPHAPYSAGPGVYRRAAELSRGTVPPETARSALRWSTHLAETLDERRFIEHGDGPFRGLLERIGLWGDEAARTVGRGLHPIEHVLDATAGVAGGPRGLLAAHVNDCPDRLIPALRDAGVHVAYCPRGHEYFRHPETTGPHRYREMLEAGVNVCLGTDSVINLPAEQAGRPSPLDEMRLLCRRDGVPPVLALEMGTLRGARALGMDESAFTLAPGGVKAGLVAVRVDGGSGTVLERVMRSDEPARLLHGSGKGPA